MKYVLPILSFLFCVSACRFKFPQIANDPPTVAYQVGFPGRVEKLEDALLLSDLQYAGMDFDDHWQKYPEYLFVVNRLDTVINYVVSLTDCQSIYYLVKWGDDWKCDSSYANIEEYSSNKG